MLIFYLNIFKNAMSQESTTSRLNAPVFLVIFSYTTHAYEAGKRMYCSKNRADNFLSSEEVFSLRTNFSQISCVAENFDVHTRTHAHAHEYTLEIGGTTVLYQEKWGRSEF